MKLVVAGSSLFVVQIFDSIHSHSDFEIVGVITQPVREHRGKQITNPVYDWAQEKSLKTLTPHKLNIDSESEAVIRSSDMLIVASYGQIISQKLLDLPTHKSINWHPSRLPRYRGPTPIQTALKNGDTDLALSWIQMNAKMDAGPVLLQIDCDTQSTDTFITVADKMGKLGAQTWQDAMQSQIHICNGSSVVSQDESKVVYCSMLSKQDKIVDAATQAATEIYNHYRAYIQFPGTGWNDSYFDGDITCLEASGIYTPEQCSAVFENEGWIVYKQGKEQIVCKKCANETLLRVEKIRNSSGKIITLSGFQFA